MANPLDLVFGSKPAVAKPTLTSLPASQSEAVGANISNFGQISNLGNLYTSYLTSSIESQIPNYAEILRTGSSDTLATLTQAGQELTGQIPQDVQDAIQRSTAYESLTSGTEGSGIAHALTARDLGLTSLELINQGANLATSGGNAAQNWARIAGGTTYNPSADFITPAQQAAQTSQNNALTQAYKQFKYNVAAAPDPGAAGVSNTLMGVLGAYLGMMGGKPSSSPSGSPGSSSTGSGLVQGGLTPYSNFGSDASVYSSTMPAFGSDYGGNTDPNAILYGDWLGSGNNDPNAILYGG